MAINAGSVFTLLGARVERKGFEQYEKELKKVQERAARKEHFQTQLGAKFDNRAFNAYERELRKATKSTDDHVRATGRLKTAFGSVYGRGGVMLGAIGATVGLGTAIQGVAKATVDFDKSMRNVNSIAQLSQKHLASLSQQVLSLAGKTAQAPDTLAKGLYDLVSSGFNAKESMTILASSAKAATAGLTDTATSTKAVAAVLNAYHRPAKDAADVSDTLFQTVNRGVISFEELSTTIGDVLPFSSSLGINLNEVGAATSTMTKEGINGFETMTRLKNLFEAFIKPGKDLAAAIKDTGAQSGEALVQSKGFQGALEAVIKTTDGSKTSVAKLFPNIRALGGALALTGGNARSAHTDLKAFGDTSGATNKALSQQAQSIAFQWQKVKAQFSATAIELGTRFAPTAIKALQATSKFLDQMDRGVGTGGDFVRVLKGMIDVFRALGRFVAGTTDIILGLFTGVLKASKAIFDLASHLPGVGDKFKGLSNRAQNAMDSINNFRESLRPARAKIVDLGDTVQKMSETMSTASRNGGLALTRNISKATHLVSQRVQNAAGDVDSGMSRIQKSLERELGQLGVSGGIKAKPLGKNFVPGLGKAAGGWIGAPGMVGHDTELALLAPGEAVLNRHQQAIVEGLLGDGFLDRLFSSVQKPHYLAKGGRVAKRYAGGGFSKGQLEGLWTGAGGSPALANVMAAIALAESGGNPTAHNPSGASGLWQILGQIVPGNIYNPQVNAANAVAKYRSQGLGAWVVYTTGAYKRFLGAGAGVPAGAAGGGGGIGPLVQHLPGLQVGGSGALQQIVQAALNAGTTGANQYLDANAPTGGGVGGGASSTTGLVPQVQRALAWARGHGWHGSVTSGFRSRAEQAVLYARYLAGGNLAAKPGTSNHERGRAVDVTDIPGFRNAMSSAPPGSRLLWFGPGDPVHFSVDGHARGRRPKHKPYHFPKAKLARHWEALRDGGGHLKDLVPPGEVLGYTTKRFLDLIETRSAEASVTGSLTDDIPWAQARQTFWQNIYNWTRRSKGGGTRIQEAARQLLDARSQLSSAIDAATPAPADTSAGITDTSTTPDPVQLPPSLADIAAAGAQDFQAYLGQQAALVSGFGSNYTRAGGSFNPGSAGVRGFGMYGGTLGAGSSGPQVGRLVVNFASAPDNAPTLVQQLRFQVENGVAG